MRCMYKLKYATTCKYTSIQRIWVFLDINPHMPVWRTFYMKGHAHAYLYSVHMCMSSPWQLEEYIKYECVCQLGWQLRCWWDMALNLVISKRQRWEAECPDPLPCGRHAAGKEGASEWLTDKHCATLWVFVVHLYGPILFFLAFLTVHLVAAPLEEAVASGGEGRRRSFQNNSKFKKEKFSQYLSCLNILQMLLYFIQARKWRDFHLCPCGNESKQTVTLLFNGPISRVWRDSHLIFPAKDIPHY